LEGITDLDEAVENRSGGGVPTMARRGIALQLSQVSFVSEHELLTVVAKSTATEALESLQRRQTLSFFEEGGQGSVYRDLDSLAVAVDAGLHIPSGFLTTDDHLRGHDGLLFWASAPLPIIG